MAISTGSCYKVVSSLFPLMLGCFYFWILLLIISGQNVEGGSSSQTLNLLNFTLYNFSCSGIVECPKSLAGQYKAIYLNYWNALLTKVSPVVRRLDNAIHCINRHLADVLR